MYIGHNKSERSVSSLLVYIMHLYNKRLLIADISLSDIFYPTIIDSSISRAILHIFTRNYEAN